MRIQANDTQVSITWLNHGGRTMGKYCTPTWFKKPIHLSSFFMIIYTSSKTLVWAIAESDNRTHVSSCDVAVTVGNLANVIRHASSLHEM